MSGTTNRIPDAWRAQLRLPVIVAPMFLVSGPELALACCRAGVGVCLPSLNARPAIELEHWLQDLDRAREQAQQDAQRFAPHGINLIVHKTNPRLHEDLAIVARHRVPFVVTSLGHPGEVVAAVHDYGGSVFADVIHAKHARRAIDAGVDGIIAIAAGAGGHAGSQNPFSLAREIREFWNGCLILGGGISDGYGVRAAECLGADLAYMGTRFIATRESRAPDAYKKMLIEAGAQDIVYTNAVTGTYANFLAPSLSAAGYPAADEHTAAGAALAGNLDAEVKAWRDLWSAGHGVANIHDTPAVAELVDRLRHEYAMASQTPGGFD